jgi:hypothetical protein
MAASGASGAETGVNSTMGSHHPSHSAGSPSRIWTSHQTLARAQLWNWMRSTPSGSERLMHQPAPAGPETRSMRLRLLATDALAARFRSMLETIILIILVLAIVGAVPTWPHSRAWGYGPSLIGLVLLVLLLAVLFGGTGLGVHHRLF